MAKSASSPARAGGRAYRLSLLLGGLPLVLGCSIFVLWLVTRWDWLMLAGVGTIFGGAFLVLAAALALFRSWRAGSKSVEVSRRDLWLATLWSALLMFANFSVAIGITSKALAVHSAVTVVVRNESGEPLEDVRVVGCGVEKQLGTLAQSAEGSWTFWPEQDGELELRVGAGREVLGVYLTPGLGGHHEVVARPAGLFTVVHGSSGLKFRLQAD